MKTVSCILAAIIIAASSCATGDFDYEEASWWFIRELDRAGMDFQIIHSPGPNPEHDCAFYLYTNEDYLSSSFEYLLRQIVLDNKEVLGKMSCEHVTVDPSSEFRYGKRCTIEYGKRHNLILTYTFRAYDLAGYIETR
jgi:hypothetical protein